MVRHVHHGLINNTPDFSIVGNLSLKKEAEDLLETIKRDLFWAWPARATKIHLFIGDGLFASACKRYMSYSKPGRAYAKEVKKALHEIPGLRCKRCSSFDLKKKRKGSIDEQP
jgi:hypothetical protein